MLPTFDVHFTRFAHSHIMDMQHWEKAILHLLRIFAWENTIPILSRISAVRKLIFGMNTWSKNETSSIWTKRDISSFQDLSVGKGDTKSF